MVYKPNRPYENKKEKLISGNRIKKRLKRKEKGESVAAILGATVKLHRLFLALVKKDMARKTESLW